MSGQDNIAPLGKQLAANDKKVRDKAVKALKTFLAGKNAEVELDAVADEAEWDEETKLEKRFSDMELAKLWKALYYCMWMSDKPLIQQQLANTLADLLLLVRPQDSNSRIVRFRAALAFLRAFWTAMLREWPGIDKHRYAVAAIVPRNELTTSLGWTNTICSYVAMLRYHFECWREKTGTCERYKSTIR